MEEGSLLQTICQNYKHLSIDTPSPLPDLMCYPLPCYKADMRVNLIWHESAHVAHWKSKQIYMCCYTVVSMRTYG